MTGDQVSGAIYGHLHGWDEDRSLRAAREVEDLMRHPGWEALADAIGEYEQMTLKSLLGKPSDSAADYAGKLGEIKGVRLLVPLAEGVVERGHAVAKRLQEASAAEAA